MKPSSTDQNNTLINFILRTSYGMLNPHSLIQPVYKGSGKLVLLGGKDG
jgi:hypothetical protein